MELVKQCTGRRTRKILCSFKCQILREKTLFSEPVTGPILLGLARTFTTAINSGVVPSFGDAWDQVSREECEVSRFSVFF
jgi:hypothetical protein